jgi:isochorismate hydrolase
MHDKFNNKKNRRIKMEKLILIINNIQDKLFSYRMDELSKNIQLMTKELDNIIDLLNSEENYVINEIFNFLNIALSNKDYLLYNDILEFELKTFLLARINTGGI